MLAISRFRYPIEPAEPTEAPAAEARAHDAALAELTPCLDALTASPGCLEITIGRALDDPSIWVLASRWRNVGDYRRALGRTDVKIAFYATAARLLDEPSAYEVVVGPGATNPNVAGSRGTIA